MPIQRKAWEIMDPEVFTISQDATVGEALHLFMDLQARRKHPCVLVVLGEGDVFKGSISMKGVLKHVKALYDDSCREGETQLMDRFTNRCRVEYDRKLRDIMSKDIHLSPSATVLDAFKRLMDEDVLSLPVVDGNKPIGMISIENVFGVIKEVMRGQR